MVIEKGTDVFRGTFSCWEGGVGRGDGIMSDDLPMEELTMRDESFHEGALGFSSIIKKKEKIN